MTASPPRMGQYDILYPQNIRDAIDKFIENNEPLDPSVGLFMCDMSDYVGEVSL